MADQPSTHYGSNCDICGCKPVIGPAYWEQGWGCDYGTCAECFENRFDEIPEEKRGRLRRCDTFEDTIRMQFEDADRDKTGVISAEEVRRAHYRDEILFSTGGYAVPVLYAR